MATFKLPKIKRPGDGERERRPSKYGDGGRSVGGQARRIANKGGVSKKGKMNTIATSILKKPKQEPVDDLPPPGGHPAKLIKQAEAQGYKIPVNPFAQLKRMTEASKAVPQEATKSDENGETSSGDILDELFQQRHEVLRPSRSAVQRQEILAKHKARLPILRKRDEENAKTEQETVRERAQENHTRGADQDVSRRADQSKDKINHRDQTARQSEFEESQTIGQTNQGTEKEIDGEKVSTQSGRSIREGNSELREDRPGQLRRHGTNQRRELTGSESSNERSGGDDETDSICDDSGGTRESTEFSCEEKTQEESELTNDAHGSRIRRSNPKSGTIQTRVQAVRDDLRTSPGIEMEPGEDNGVRGQGTAEGSNRKGLQSTGGIHQERGINEAELSDEETLSRKERMEFAEPGDQSEQGGAVRGFGEFENEETLRTAKARSLESETDTGRVSRTTNAESVRHTESSEVNADQQRIGRINTEGGDSRRRIQTLENDLPAGDGVAGFKATDQSNEIGTEGDQAWEGFEEASTKSSLEEWAGAEELQTQISNESDTKSGNLQRELEEGAGSQETEAAGEKWSKTLNANKDTARAMRTDPQLQGGDIDQQAGGNKEPKFGRIDGLDKGEATTTRAGEIGEVNDRANNNCGSNAGNSSDNAKHNLQSVSNECEANFGNRSRAEKGGRSTILDGAREATLPTTKETAEDQDANQKSENGKSKKEEGIVREGYREESIHTKGAVAGGMNGSHEPNFTKNDIQIPVPGNLENPEIQVTAQDRNPNTPPAAKRKLTVYSAEQEEDLAGIMGMPGVVCNRCPAADSCPEFSENSSCAFDEYFMGLPSRDLENVIPAMESFADMQAMRARRAVFLEQRVTGGQLDPNVSRQINIASEALEHVARIKGAFETGQRKSLTVIAQGENPQGGILARLMSGITGALPVSGSADLELNPPRPTITVTAESEPVELDHLRSSGKSTS